MTLAIVMPLKRQKLKLKIINLDTNKEETRRSKALNLLGNPMASKMLKIGTHR